MVLKWPFLGDTGKESFVHTLLRSSRTQSSLIQKSYAQGMTWKWRPLGVALGGKDTALLLFRSWRKKLFELVEFYWEDDFKIAINQWHWGRLYGDCPLWSWWHSGQFLHCGQGVPEHHQDHKGGHVYQSQWPIPKQEPWQIPTTAHLGWGSAEYTSSPSSDTSHPPLVSHGLPPPHIMEVHTSYW